MQRGSWVGCRFLMKEAFVIVAIGILVTTIWVGHLAVGSAGAEVTEIDLGLAEHWAPQWWQDTDSDDRDADYLTNFDFDDDWNATNNWENQPYYPSKAYVYYWVVETDTNWFIGYATYHPRNWRDWGDFFATAHENDMEGCILAIRKDGSKYGQFLAMMTRAHNDLYTYIDNDAWPSNALKDGRETIDGDVQFAYLDHPYAYIEAKGHAVYGAKRWEDTGFPGGDGVIYTYERGVAEEPDAGANSESVDQVRYDLTPINALWDRRSPQAYPDTFADFGTFQGDLSLNEKWMKEDAANAPWRWDDENDGIMQASQDIFLHPYHLFDYYLEGLGNFSHNRIHQSYLADEPSAIIVTVDGLSIVNTVFDAFGLDWDARNNDLEVALQSMEQGPCVWDVIPFRWDGDAYQTDDHVTELRAFLRSQYGRAQSEGQEFIVVSKSWGTVLTQMALSLESGGSNPITPALYITLGSPLGTEHARDGNLTWQERVIQDFVSDRLAEVDDSDCADCRPSVGMHVNYWAWGDLFSGPIPSADMNLRMTGADTVQRNLVNTRLWHASYLSQQSSSEENTGFADHIRDLITQTVSCHPSELPIES